jgi:hypothetical protein
MRQEEIELSRKEKEHNRHHDLGHKEPKKRQDENADEIVLG